jgi:CHAD domain-containing protein
MTDGSLAGNLAEPIDHIVARDSTRLVDNKKPVHIINLAAGMALANCGVTIHSKEMAGELERVQKALRDLGRSLKRLPAHPQPEQVHKLRTSTRRVEAIAAALEQVNGKQSKRLVRSIEPLRKAAGSVRDMDVLTANIRKLSQTAPAESLARLVDHLESARADEARELRHTLHRERRDARHNLKNYSRKVQSVSAAEISAQNGHARNGHQRNGMNPTAKHIARELAEWPALDEHNIHEFRLKVKQLRYILQLDAHGDPNFVAALGTAQRRIGDWHDWQQLAEIAHEFLEPAQDQQLLAQIDKTMQQKLERALAASKSLRRQYLRSAVLHVLGC